MGQNVSLRLLKLNAKYMLNPRRWSNNYQKKSVELIKCKILNLISNKVHCLIEYMNTTYELLLHKAFLTSKVRMSSDLTCIVYVQRLNDY